MVTITADNYGQAGGVTETLPSGFVYVSSSLDTDQVTVTGQEVRFTLQGDDSFTYTVTASGRTGSHRFSGTLRDFDRTDTPVGGVASVTVKSSSGGLAARASRSFDNPSVAQDGEVVVTIDVANYGQAGGVTETLPSGFTFVSSSLDTEQVTVTGQVELTPIEYRLLYELSVNAGRVLTHDYLLRRIWGPEYLGYSQPVRSFVKKLRHKLGDDPKSPMYIYTEPRVGYRMEKGY